MEGKNSFPYGKGSYPQFKRKGGSRRGKRNSSRGQDISKTDTVYRILCHDSKIGGVIGKGGSTVRALMEETRAKIIVAESAPGSDERVITIHSPPAKISKRVESNKDLASKSEEKEMEPVCPAQDALLKVHERITEEDSFGGMSVEDGNNINEVTTRLLVTQNMVGCLIGKGGDVIQKLRSETGAAIRVLPRDDRPSFALDTDELVQISGPPLIVKKALYIVSTKLHQNPRKDNKPSGLARPFREEDFIPPRGPMWPHQNFDFHGMPPRPFSGGYRNQPSRFVPGGFDGPGPGEEESGEFSMKILCSSAKIGRVIGKAASIVKELEQETGASIRVGAVSAESDERVIRVSAFESLWNPRSQTIDAILELQNKIREYSDKGQITTRLLVPSSKIGCLLGEGGRVINEMRRRTQADIRIFPKDDRPKCASEDEELVQISATFAIARDTLGEIASRLRTRTLRDANAREMPHSDLAFQRFSPGESLPRRRTPSFDAVGADYFGRYEPYQVGRHEYERPAYPFRPVVNSNPNFSNYTEPRFPNDAAGSTTGLGRSIKPGIDELTGARIRLQGSQAGGSECVVDIRGSSEHLTAAKNILQAYTTSAGQGISSQQNPYTNYAPQGSYQGLNSQQDPYQGIKGPQGAYQSTGVAQQSSLQDTNYQQVPYQGSYQDVNSKQGSYLGLYQGNNTQQGSHEDPLLSYQSAYAPQGTYQNANAQQGSYQNANAQQGSYQNANAQQGSYPSLDSYQDFYRTASAQQNSYQGTTAQQNPYQTMDAQQGSYQTSVMPQSSSYQK